MAHLAYGREQRERLQRNGGKQNAHRDADALGGVRVQELLYAFVQCKQAATADTASAPNSNRLRTRVGVGLLAQVQTG